MGITDKRTDLAFNQTVICEECGSYGQYIVYMTCTVLSLFFLPVFHWNRHYYVQTSCCGTVYELNAEIGRKIENGENVTIHTEDLQLLNNYRYSTIRRCEYCGFTTKEDYDYCPKCGNPLH